MEKILSVTKLILSMSKPILKVIKQRKTSNLSTNQIKQPGKEYSFHRATKNQYIDQFNQIYQTQHAKVPSEVK